jgi:hypothetical protein
MQRGKTAASRVQWLAAIWQLHLMMMTEKRKKRRTKKKISSSRMSFSA